MSLVFHAFAEIFPLIEGAAFEAFVEDIRENGIRDPIVIHEASILDGRNRYRALLALRDTAKPRGSGWGVYADTPVADDDLDPSQGYGWFERYSTILSGDPLSFVMSRNVRRRHLEKGQIAYAIAQYEVFRHGGARRGDPVQAANLQLENTAQPQPETRARLAEEHGVSERLIAGAAVVRDHGVDDLKAAVRSGTVAVSRAEEIARLPEQQQHEEVRRALPNGARAIMSSRIEPADSRDYFPTPPWATRALIEIVLPHIGVDIHKLMSAWEPACGEGHIAEVLREYVRTVHASDKFEYGYGEQHDYLNEEARVLGGTSGVHWIFTNPPFEDKALQFVLRALDQAKHGVAMFFRSQWAVEGIERYETLFRDRPPTVCAFFVERVPLCEGRWDPTGSTATAYCWLVWDKTKKPMPTFWIPNECRQKLKRDDDIERFTARPVTKRARGGMPHILRAPPIEEPPANESRSIGNVPQALSKPIVDDNLEIPAFLRRCDDKHPAPVTVASPCLAEVVTGEGAG